MYCFSSEQMFQMKNCVKLFLNPCINVQVIVWTSLIYDHFLIWPSRVTLTFNLSEQMFQMELLLLKDNNCAKLFEIHANCTPYGPDKTIFDHCIHAWMYKFNCYSLDKLNLWPFFNLPSSMTLTFNLTEQIIQMIFLPIKGKGEAKSFWCPCINV